jgi:hypothetical protein
MVNRGFFPKITFFIFLLFSFAVSSYAQRATQVLPSGMIRLDDGKTVALAGIIPSEEAIAVISIMLAGKDISFEKEASEKYVPAVPGAEAGYLYLESKEIDFPFNPKSGPREKKWMLNRFLLTLGMASAESDKEFKYKEDFIKEEALARQKGEFIEKGAMVTKKK